VLNKLLIRQIYKHIGEPEAFLQNFLPLLQTISESYDHYEKDRKMLERSIDLSSEEMIDLNKRLKAEKVELERREANLQEAQRIARIGNWEADFKTRKTSWSDQMYEIFEVGKEDINPSFESYLSFIHPEDVEETRKKIEEEEKFHKLYSFTCRIVTKTGIVKHIYTDCKFDFDHMNQPVKLHGIIQDITEQHISESKVRHSEARLKQAQSIAHVGNWEVNFATNISVWSDEAYRIYGLTPGEYQLAFEEWLSFVHPEDLEGFKNEMNKAQETLGDLIYYHRIIRRDGKIRYVCSQSKYEFDLIGRPIGLYGIVHDITEQKKTELQLQTLLDITKEQNARLQNFAYIVSHNIRSHSANIVGLVDHLKDMVTEEDSWDIFNMLQTSTHKLGETIENLNEIITIQNDAREEMVKIDLRKEIEVTCNAINALILESSTKIINNTPEKLFIKAVPSYIESILLNLLTNAIKYRDMSRPSIIDFSVQENDKYIVLLIRDNGIGIDLEKNGSKLFGMYKTFSNNKNARGIGLFITKNQVEAMNGKIEVESGLGKGSTFKVSFLIDKIEQPVNHILTFHKENAEIIQAV
jgi:PAS domain S-box-containing protein